MKRRVVRLVGVAAFYLFTHLGAGVAITSCSSSNSESEELETTAEEGDQSANENLTELNNGEEGAHAEATAGGDENLANANLGQANEAAHAQEGELPENLTSQTGNSSDNGLTEIISELNNTQNPPAQAANPNVSFNNVPTNVPMDQSSNMQVGTNEQAPTMDQVPMAMAEATNFSAPMGQSLPEEGSKMPYFVQRGDTLGTIAQKIYGKKSAWKDLANLSGLSDPNKIYPGDVVYYQLNKESMTFAQKYENTPRQEVVVGPNDTLASIAKKVLGNSKNWKFIWRQNDNVDNPDQLKEGTVLYFVSTQNMAEVKQLTKQTLLANKVRKVKVTKVKMSKNKFAMIFDIASDSKNIKA